MAPKTPMDGKAASRIQSTQAKAGNPVGKGSFPAKAQSAAVNNTAKGAVGGAKDTTASAKVSNSKPAKK